MGTAPDSQFDYPVDLANDHEVLESNNYEGDKFICRVKDAYNYTGAWPTYNYCPFCGVEL